MSYFEFSKIKLLIAIQPIFFIMMIQTCISDQLLVRHFALTPVLGFILGMGLLYVITRNRFDMKTHSIERVFFLAGPCAFFLLCLLPGHFNTNLYFIVFFVLWIFSAAKLYVRGNQKKPENARIGLLVGAAVIILLLTATGQGMIFTPDSYSYFDISKNIFSDFGEISTIRQYVNLSEWNLSFPWLYPALISIVDAMTGFGMFSGVFINFIAAYITLWIILKITCRLTDSYIPGIFVSLLLFTDPGYVQEVISARSITTSILCVTVMLYIFVKLKDYTKKDMFLAGLFAGAGMAIRFDFLVIAGLTGLILLPVFKKKALVMMAAYGLGILVFTTPWIIYSISQFSTIWATDNGGTFSLTYAISPQRFFLPNEMVSTLFTDFPAWAEKVWSAAGLRLSQIITWLLKPVNILLLGFCAYVFVVSPKEQEEAKIKNKPFRILSISVSLICIAKLCVYFAAAYTDTRYHSEIVMMLMLLLLTYTYMRAGNKIGWRKPLFLMPVVLMIQLAPVMETNLIPKLAAKIVDKNLIYATKEEEETAKILRSRIGAKTNKDVRVYFVDSTNAFRYGALMNLHSYAVLINENKERLLYLFDHFIKPDYIYSEDFEKYDLLRNNLSEYYTFEVTGQENIYKVIRKSK
ncbi:MAG: glycosyltransferase family 39 protein [Lachnoclostridium sp.]|nr:glycosyltransferase family 39 protein [Lachnoclostridium sp.]